MPNRVRLLTVPDADRAELERRAQSKGAGGSAVDGPGLVPSSEVPPTPG